MKINIYNAKLRNIETLKSYSLNSKYNVSIVFTKQVNTPTLGNNLQATHYQNGDPIPLAVSDKQWAEFGSNKIGAYSITEDGDYLYNWYAVDDNKGLAPKGWHIPTDKEWNNLENQLKENPTYAGYRNSGGNSDYIEFGYYGFFWSSSEYCSSNAWRRLLSCNHAVVGRYDFDKRRGYSVRCVRD